MENTVAEHTYTPNVGTHISRACFELARDAIRNLAPTIMKFNDIEITAYPGDRPTLLEQRWEAAMQAAAAAYHSSPEYAARQEARAAEVEKGRALVTILMELLDSLDFSDVDTVLDWVYEIADPSDDTGIGVPASTIVATLSAHGYEPNVNVGEAYDGTNRENVARYIIGQALDGLRTLGAIHPIAKVFIERYRRGEVGYGAKVS